MKHEAYMNRKNRDQRAMELNSLGYKTKRYTIRNQQLHPMYVKDYPYPLSQADKGIGNTIYKTRFGVLYLLDYE